MRIQRLVAAAALLALAAAIVPAERVTVDRAVELAVANNLGLASERVGVETKKLVRDTAWNAFIPTVSVGTSLSRPNEDPNVSSATDYPRWYLGLSLSAQLPLNAALRNGIQATVIDYESGRLSLETAEKQLARDVRKSFYNLLLLRENIDIMEKSIANADKRYAQASANYEAGLVPKYSVLSAHVALENLKPPLEDLRNGFEAALGSFRLTLGLDRTAPVELDGSIETTPATVDAAQLIAGRPPERLDMRSLDLAITGLRNAREAAVNQRLAPTLTFLFSMDPSYQKDPWESGWLADIDTNWLQRTGAFVISLTLPVDGFFANSRTRVEIAKLDGQIRQTELRRAQTLRGAEVEIETLVHNLNKARTSIATLELNVGLAEEAHRLADEAYNAGGRDLLEAQNAELELNKARLEVLKAKYGYITGLLDLEYAVNMSLRGEGRR